MIDSEQSSSVKKPAPQKADQSPAEQSSPEKKTIKKPDSKIRHSGFRRDDPRQQIVQYAYQLGGLDLVTLMECENGTREITRRGDAGMSVGICQMHTGYHRLPADYFTSRKKQVEVCNEKRRGGTKFY